jgi:hypothetical protein
VSWTTGWALSERHQRRRQDLIICLRSCLVDSPGLFLPGMSWLGGLLDSILAFGRTRKPLNRPSNALTASLYSIVLLKEFTHQQRDNQPGSAVGGKSGRCAIALSMVRLIRFVTLEATSKGNDAMMTRLFTAR